MIFYFSGTGNSLAVAQYLERVLDEPVRSMAERLNQGQTSFQLQPNERIGFVFPIYFYTVPRRVVDFIRHMRFTASAKPYVFAVMTCGGQTGQAGRILERLLLRQRLELSYQAAVVLPDNYITLLKLPNADKQKRLFLAADLDLVEIAGHISAGQTGDCNTKKGPWSAAITACTAPFYRNGRKTGRFYVTDSCTQCRLCGEICPDQAITLQNDRPVWTRDRCTFCLACLHRCPVEAIEYGRSTKGKTRYSHPDVIWPTRELSS